MKYDKWMPHKKYHLVCYQNFCYATNGHIIPLSLPTVSPKSALQAFKTTKNAQSPTLLMLKQLQAVIAN